MISWTSLKPFCVQAGLFDDIQFSSRFLKDSSVQPVPAGISELLGPDKALRSYRIHIRLTGFEGMTKLRPVKMLI